MNNGYRSSLPLWQVHSLAHPGKDQLQKKGQHLSAYFVLTSSQDAMALLPGLGTNAANLASNSMGSKMRALVPSDQRFLSFNSSIPSRLSSRRPFGSGGRSRYLLILSPLFACPPPRGTSSEFAQKHADKYCEELYACFEGNVMCDDDNMETTNCDFDKSMAKDCLDGEYSCDTAAQTVLSPEECSKVCG